MTKEREVKTVERRSFLKLAGVAGAAAATAGVTAATTAEAETASDAGGYRETEHVLTYYQTARF